jgi:hypothetical protein
MNSKAPDFMPFMRFKTKKLMRMRMKSAQAHRLQTKHLVFTVFESNKRTDGTTMATLWRMVAWSLQALFDGRWPALDHEGQAWPAGSAELAVAGTPLAAGKFAVPFLLKGDWDHFSKTFHLPRPNSNKPCWLCRCEKGPGSDIRDWPTNFRREARWKVQLISPVQWRAETQGQMHVLFRTFAFLTNANVEADELHVIHLGTSQYMLGSILYLLVFKILPGRPAENMEVLWQEMCHEYSRQGIKAQFSSLGISMFCDPKAPHASYPRLKGRAAEVKWLVPVLNALWPKYRRPGSPMDRLVAELLQTQQVIQELLDAEASEFQMSSESARELSKATDKLLATYSRAAVAANELGELLFSVVPKHHMLWHFSRKAWHLHPRRGACSTDEDYMSAVKQLVKGCMHALPLQKIPLALLQKYRWGLAYEHLRIVDE